MPPNKKKAKPRKKGGGGGSVPSEEEPDNNAEVLASLHRLAETLAHLDEARDPVEGDNAAEERVEGLVDDTAALTLGDDAAATASENDKADTSQSPPTLAPALPLSHYRALPLPVQSAYTILNDGASYLHATSTKYTLVGKVDDKEGGNLALELRKGAELIGTATLLFFSPSCGAGRSLRHYVKMASRALIASVIALVQSFEEGLAQGKANDGNNLGARKTGAVWAACDKITKSLPKGNRAAMRRELLVWVRDCNESIAEFDEVLELGPREEGEGEEAMVDEEQYTEAEMTVARAAVHLMKCSKNLLGLVLKACDCVGEQADEPQTDAKQAQSAEAEGASVRPSQNGEDTAQQMQEEESKRRKELLRWIGNLHEMARTVGEGVTNLGILLYPPLDPASDADALEKWEAKKQTLADCTGEHAIPSLGATPLGMQLEHQLRAISECVARVHHATLSSGEDIRDCLSNEVAEGAERLQRAVGVRCREAAEAMAAWDPALRTNGS